VPVVEGLKQDCFRRDPISTIGPECPIGSWREIDSRGQEESVGPWEVPGGGPAMWRARRAEMRRGTTCSPTGMETCIAGMQGGTGRSAPAIGGLICLEPTGLRREPIGAKVHRPLELPEAPTGSGKTPPFPDLHRLSREVMWTASIETSPLVIGAPSGLKTSIALRARDPGPGPPSPHQGVGQETPAAPSEAVQVPAVDAQAPLEGAGAVQVGAVAASAVEEVVEPEVAVAASAVEEVVEPEVAAVEVEVAAVEVEVAAVEVEVAAVEVEDQEGEADSAPSFLA